MVNRMFFPGKKKQWWRQPSGKKTEKLKAFHRRQGRWWKMAVLDKRWVESKNNFGDLSNKLGTLNNKGNGIQNMRLGKKQAKKRQFFI